MNQHNYELFASRLDWDYPALDDARALLDEANDAVDADAAAGSGVTVELA